MDEQAVQLTEAFSAPYDMPGPEPEPVTAAEAVAADDERLAENERFKIWEAGYLAGLNTAVAGQGAKNPYVWHGLGYAPSKANLSDVQVRVFLGSTEMTVAAVGSIVSDRHGMRIESVYINPEPGTR